MILTHRFFVLLMIGLLWSSCRKETTEVPRVPRAVPVENSSGSDNVILKTVEFPYGLNPEYNSETFVSENDFHSRVEVSGSLYFQLYSKISTTINMTFNMSPQKLGSIIDSIKTRDILISVRDYKLLLNDSVITKLKKFRNIGIFYLDGSDKSIDFLKKFALKIQKPLHVAIGLKKSSLLYNLVNIDNLVSLKVYLSTWAERINAFPSFKDLKNLEINTPCPDMYEKFDYTSIVDLALVQKKLRTLRIRPRKNEKADDVLNNKYFLQLKKGLTNFRKFYIEGAACGEVGFSFFVTNKNYRMLNLLFDPSVNKPLDYELDSDQYISSISRITDEKLSEASGKYFTYKSFENLLRLNNFKNYNILKLDMFLSNELFQTLPLFKHINQIELTGDTPGNSIVIMGPKQLKSLNLKLNNKNKLMINLSSLGKLEKLALDGDGTITKVSVPSGIKKIEIKASKIDPLAFNLSELSNLEVIEGHLTDQNASTLFSLVKSKNLKEVDLTCSDKSKPFNLKAISTGVKKLNLSYCMLSEETLRAIFKSRIENLTCYSCVLPSESIKFSNSLIELTITNTTISTDFLGSIFDSDLQKLTFNECKFQDETVHIPKINKTILELTMVSPRDIDDSKVIFFRNLENLSKLRLLRLFNLSINKEEFISIAKAPSLEICEFYGLGINGDGLVDLKASSTLRIIFNNYPDNRFSKNIIELRMR